MKNTLEVFEALFCILRHVYLGIKLVSYVLIVLNLVIYYNYYLLLRV